MKNEILFSVKPVTQTKTRIMATLGPRTLDYETLRNMVLAGASLFRFNGAHLEREPEPGQISYSQARQIVDHIRQLRNELRQVIGIYFDLGGPKMRIQSVLSAKVVADRERCLHPDVGDEVTLRAYNDQTAHDFKKLNDEFATRYAAGKTKAMPTDFWDSPEGVRQFFSQPGTADHYELMFARDAPDFGEFRANGTRKIHLKDGWCELNVRDIDVAEGRMHCVVQYRDSKFEFRPHQGANPHQFLFRKVITDKDELDIIEALKLGADIISLSFVCLPVNAIQLRDMIGDARASILQDAAFISGQSAIYREYIDPHKHQIPIFAKIETAFAVDYELGQKYALRNGLRELDRERRDPLWEIAEIFDGLMVARGDLAVEVAKYAVPELQRRIIRIARLKNKPVIVATEMLESMKRGDASTRAEIGDINTAVRQGADILMLSGETASTKGRPEHAVTEMRAAIEYAEREGWPEDQEPNLDRLERQRAKEISGTNRADPRAALSRLSQGAQVCSSARALGAEAVLASAQTGETVREIAYYRPPQKVIAMTENVLTAVRLLLHRGVYPVVMARPLTRTVDDFVEIAHEIHRAIGIPVPAGTTEKFRLPGLIRIIPVTSAAAEGEEIPNSIHEFTLPVEPGPMHEIERKYVLSRAGYDRLRVALRGAGDLRGAAVRCDELRQENWYFADSQGLLARRQIMLRIRIEQSLDARPISRRILLTIKGPPRAAEAAGFADRVEQEFDMTGVWPASADLSEWRIGGALMLPEFHRNELGKWLPGLEREVELKAAAHMVNLRLQAVMSNGFVLELDRSTFSGEASEVTEYELEVELHAGSGREHVLDEYIHDKFAALDIPIVYGPVSKLERLFLHAGRSDPPRASELMGILRGISQQVESSHRAGCSQCQQTVGAVPWADDSRSRRPSGGSRRRRRSKG